MEVDKEDVPTSLQSRDDGEKTEKASMQIAQASCEVRNSSDHLQAMIDSLQEALAASEKRADQQALRRASSASAPNWA